MGDPWETEPLLGPAWRDSASFKTTSTARHQLLAAARQALSSSDGFERLHRLARHLRSRPSPGPSECGRLLAHALTRYPDAETVRGYLAAVVAYADFRERFPERLPVSAPPAQLGGFLDPRWLLDDGFPGGARERARQLSVLDAAPVREPLGILRAAERAGATAGGGLRPAVQLVPRLAASAARGVKRDPSSAPARLELFRLGVWGVRQILADQAALSRVVLPAFQAIIAYHHYFRAVASPGTRVPRKAARPVSPAPAPPGYLAAGFFAPDGTVDPMLIGDHAEVWAERLTAGRASHHQVRRIFHELRRIERQLPGRAWAETRGQLVNVVPLAAEAAARGFRERQDLRALEQLLRISISRLVEMPEQEQPRAFREALLPHLEMVLARFTARTLGGPGPVVPLPEDDEELHDVVARQVARRIRNGGVSVTLLWRAYAHLRTVSRRRPEELPAHLERFAGLVDDALRRSTRASKEAVQAVRTLVRQGRMVRPEEFSSRYVRYFASVLAWAVSLDALEGGSGP